MAHGTRSSAGMGKGGRGSALMLLALLLVSLPPSLKRAEATLEPEGEHRRQTPKGAAVLAAVQADPQLPTPPMGWIEQLMLVEPGMVSEGIKALYEGDVPPSPASPSPPEPYPPAPRPPAPPRSTYAARLRDARLRQDSKLGEKLGLHEKGPAHGIDEGFVGVRTWEWPTARMGDQPVACQSLYCPQLTTEHSTPNPPRWLDEAVHVSSTNDTELWKHVPHKRPKERHYKRAPRAAHPPHVHTYPPHPPPPPPPSPPPLPPPPAAPLWLDDDELAKRDLGVEVQDIIRQGIEIPQAQAEAKFAQAEGQARKKFADYVALNVRRRRDYLQNWYQPGRLRQLPDSPTANEPVELEAGYFNWRACPEGCSEYGTCNLEMGRCDCIPGYAGPDCQQLAMPACIITQNNTGRKGKSSRRLWEGIVTEYHTPCAATAYKTCECQRQCASKFVNFQHQDRRISPKCLDSPEAVIDKQSRCSKSCNFRGWCDRNEVCNCFVGWQGTACQTPASMYCINDCSGRGSCRGGTCHCQHGFYGADCSLYKGKNWPASSRLTYRDGTTASVGDTTHTKREVKIYVYELPPYLNTWMYYYNPFSFQNTNAHPSLHSPEGRSFYVGAAELFLHERFLTSAHRTTDPNDADYFFVPYLYRATYNLQNRHVFLERVVNYVKATWPYWNRNGGSDHIFVMAGAMGMCETTFDRKGARPGAVREAIILTHFGGVAHGRADPRARHNWKGPCFLKDQDIVIPPPLRISTAKSPLLHSGNFFQRLHTLFFAGGLSRAVQVLPDGERTPRWQAGDHLRDVRIEAFHAMEGKVGYMVNTTAARLRPEEYTEMLASSVFCLAPAATGPAWPCGIRGVRLVEAIVYGCIPVIIQDDVHQPFDDFLNYKEFSISVSASRAPQIANILGNFTESNWPRIREMQANLKCVARRFLWSSVYGRYGTGSSAETGLDDAFMTVLDVLNARRVALGKRPPALVVKHKVTPWAAVPDMARPPPRPVIKKLAGLCGKDVRVERAGAKPHVLSKGKETREPKLFAAMPLSNVAELTHGGDARVL